MKAVAINPAPAPLAFAPDLVSEPQPLLRGLVWLYIFLLIFEGALRKWVFPEYSTPLLIVRDPLVILIYLVAIFRGEYPRGAFLTTLYLLAGGMLVFGLLAEQLSLKVYLFGARSDFLHLPLLFLIPRVLHFDDVVQLGKWLLLAALPMGVLIIFQFLGSPDDLINVAVGGKGRQIETTGGKVRAAGTFSFITGVVSFYQLCAAFLMVGFLRRGTYSFLLLLTAAGAVFAAVVASGSRLAVLSVVGVCVTTLALTLVNRRFLGQAVATAAIVGVVAVMVMQVNVTQQSMSNLSERFAVAGGSRGIQARVYSVFVSPFYAVPQAPFFGAGLGLGTNAGSALTSGKVVFVLGENEWERLIMESGPLLGLLFIGWRVALVIHLGRVSWRALREENALPALILSASALLLLNGPLGQPTSLGFAVIGGGLCLAAARRDTALAEAPAPSSGNRVRARSRYAQHLHGRRKKTGAGEPTAQIE